MSITIHDPALVAELLKTQGPVLLESPDGQQLGEFNGENLYKLPPGKKSPFTDEQLLELRKQRDGRPLADILRDLKERE